MASQTPWPSLERKEARSEDRAFPVTPTTQSWNQVVGFLTDWEELRKLAA